MKALTICPPATAIPGTRSFLSKFTPKLYTPKTVAGIKIKTENSSGGRIWIPTNEDLVVDILDGFTPEYDSSGRLINGQIFVATIDETEFHVLGSADDQDFVLNNLSKYDPKLLDAEATHLLCISREFTGIVRSPWESRIIPRFRGGESFLLANKGNSIYLAYEGSRHAYSLSDLHPRQDLTRSWYPDIWKVVIDDENNVEVVSLQTLRRLEQKDRLLKSKKRDIKKAQEVFNEGIRS
jgi:hypothetical protein